MVVFIDYFKFPLSVGTVVLPRAGQQIWSVRSFHPRQVSRVREAKALAAGAAGMNINSDSDEEQSPPASNEKENATRLARQCGSPGCDLKDFHLGPCKSQHGSRPSGKASAAHWPSGTAAWVSRNNLFFPVVTGGYRDNPAPNKPGLVRVRYVSVKDKHRPSRTCHRVVCAHGTTCTRVPPPPCRRHRKTATRLSSPSSSALPMARTPTRFSERRDSSSSSAP